MDLQPWNSSLTLEPHSCPLCQNIILDPNIAETEDFGRRTHKYVICDFAKEVLRSTQGQPSTCGLIRHHIAHRGAALEDAIRSPTQAHNPHLMIEIHSLDGNGYDIRTAYTMFWGHRLAEFNVYAIEGVYSNFLCPLISLLNLCPRRSCSTFCAQTAEKT
jgi:hypothetical protein